jgi:hypothetical protein
MDEFFSDEAAYRAWIAGLPGIFPCHDFSGRQGDPGQPWVSQTEGPYFYSPHFLLLRVGLDAAAARYCAVRRVGREAEADFFWFVGASPGRPDGERVYAAYVWDTSTRPQCVIAGDTLGEAHARLTAYLSTGRLRGGITRNLS